MSRHQKIPQKSFLSLLLAGVLIAHSSNVFAAMSSTNYQINWDELSSGGGVGSSASYQIRDSAGGSGEGSRASSTNYSLDQGFRAGIYDPVVDFVSYIQDRSTQVAATAFSSNTVTVTTASGFTIGDWIAIIQDEGASQISAMAHITNISGSNITVHSSYSGLTPTIDGSNDYVYRMSSNVSPSLGTLSTSLVSTSMIGWVATADITQGFSMYMFSNGNLTDGPDTIPAVSDGSVTAGTSEYGGKSSDSTLATSTFDTQDTAFTTDPTLVGSVPTNATQSSGFVTLKTAISSSQVAGSYAQTLTAIFVGDY
ncbi:MAG: hypothetical protein QX199_19845 [Methylococcaceae bacterium]